MSKFKILPSRGLGAIDVLQYRVVKGGLRKQHATSKKYFLIALN